MKTEIGKLALIFQICFNRNQWKFLGCEIESPEGELIYYVFKVMIYGLKCAVHLATKLTRPIVRKAALMGIRLSIMIDDGRVLGRTKLEREENLRKVLDITERAGWNINWDKTVTEASLALYHQGFVTCTKPLMYILPEFKVKNLLELIAEVLEQKENGTKISGEVLAKLVGSLVSARIALGPVCRILLRSAHNLLAYQTQDYLDMKRKFHLSDQAAGELQLLYQLLPQLNGQPILLSQTGVTLQQLLNSVQPQPHLPFTLEGGNTEQAQERLYRGRLPQEKMLDIEASDSSDFQEFVYSVQRPNEAFLRKMTVEETELSSGQRELGAILHSMEANANLLYSPEPAIIY